MIFLFPIASMYGIFTYMYHKFKPNVGEYAIHGSYGFSNRWDMSIVPWKPIVSHATEAIGEGGLPVLEANNAWVN